MKRVATGLMMVVCVGCLACEAYAVGEPPAVRREIREMPLIDRPNRAGHFYGNWIRRLHGRRDEAGRARPPEEVRVPDPLRWLPPYERVGIDRRDDPIGAATPLGVTPSGR